MCQTFSRNGSLIVLMKVKMAWPFSKGFLKILILHSINRYVKIPTKLSMLKRIRVTLAMLSIFAVTLLFLDFTGFAREHWSWLAKIQLVPAILSVNLLAILFLLAVTLVFGRIYCSVICPLGIMQDFFTWLRGHVKINRRKHNLYNFKKAYTAVRWLVFGLFVILLAMPVTHMIASLIEPYSAYGRIASSIMAPVYDAANNIGAEIAANHGSYAMSDVSRNNSSTLIAVIAWTTLIVIGGTAFFFGRDYCNTICPVGTLLGYLSRFSILKPWIDTSKCNGCTKCARNCKASCIDPVRHEIDYTRCVACMNCIGNCSTHALRYGLRRQTRGETHKPERDTDGSRRAAILTGVTLVGAMTAKAVEDKLSDGGLAPVVEKRPLDDRKRIVPPGAVSVKNLTDHCTGCQLCIDNCPNEVLRPSADFETFMQPVMQFDKGYCRPECTACSDVCPVGAIKPLDTGEKSVIQIGLAVVNRDACISASEGVNCGNCSRHCPSDAIVMIPVDADDDNGNKMPVVNERLCIGCGACENLCPVSPVSAIHVEGRMTHTQVRTA